MQSDLELTRTELKRWIGGKIDEDNALSSSRDIWVLVQVVSIYLQLSAVQHEYRYFSWALEQATRSEKDAQKLGAAWRDILIGHDRQSGMQVFPELVGCRAPELLSALTEQVISLFPEKRRIEIK